MIVLYFILLIGVLIFVHELGHFLFAKLFGVKVLKFSLGFGPKAIGFKKGETEYCISWLPLGGFVKMLGQDPDDAIRPEDQGRALNQKPLWQRFIVFFAGPAFNLIFPIFIYFVFFASQTTAWPPVIGKVFKGQPAAQAGLKPGDKIVSISGNRIRYWEDLQRHVYDRPGQPLKFQIERDGKRFERFITPKEYVRATRLGSRERYGLIGISPELELAQIAISDPRSPAARAGLRTGDLVTSVNGKPVERWTAMAKVLDRNRGQSLRISFLRPGPSVSGFTDLHVMAPFTTVVDPEPKHKNGKLRYETGIFSAEFFVQEVEKGSPAEKIGMRPGDRVISFNGKPVTEAAASFAMLRFLHPHSSLREFLRTKDEYTIGWVPFGGGKRAAKFKLAHISYTDEYRHKQTRVVFGAHNRMLTRRADPIPIEGRFSHAAVRSVRKTGEIVGVMAFAIVQFFRGGIPRDSIGGPIMLAYTAQVAARKGWDHFLWMMALISINLGIINLLPIPILDGGHIMFLVIEAIKRKPLSLRAREIASYVGLFLLIVLMIYAMRNDIRRYF
jgi:regulator of sigma E protease